MKTMKKLILVITFLISSYYSANAQNMTYSDIKKITLRNVGAITENDIVKGYYMFYFVDKANGTQNNYKLIILDNNLQETHDIDLTKPKDLIFLECSYNGSNFCISFVNEKTKSAEYMVLNKKGEKTGNYKITGLSSSEIAYLTANIDNEDYVYSGGLAGIQDKGFVRYGMEKEKGMRFEIEMIDSTGKKLWSTNSGVTTKKSYESAYPMMTTGDAVVSLVSIREKLLSQDFETFLLFSNVEDGKELFRVAAKNDQYILFPGDVDFDNKTNEYLISGEYFNLKDNPVKDKSLGFYFQTVDTEGNIKNTAYCSWLDDIAKVIPMTDKGKFENNVNVAIHKIVRTADGKIFAIGEQFKKAASAVGILTYASSNSNVSAVKVQLYNMMVFQFDKDFKIKDVSIFEKEKTNIDLPKGFEYFGNTMLSYFMKMYGWFDYSFTSLSSDKKQFNVAYVNYDKSNKEVNKSVIGTISYTKDQKLTSDKINLTKKITWFTTLPAKPGYIAVIEYYRKTKTLDIRLEKLNI